MSVSTMVQQGKDLALQIFTAHFTSDRQYCKHRAVQQTNYTILYASGEVGRQVLVYHVNSSETKKKVEFSMDGKWDE